jgi:hypothetical protein
VGVQVPPPHHILKGLRVLVWTLFSRGLRQLQETDKPLRQLEPLHQIPRMEGFKTLETGGMKMQRKVSEGQ